MEIVGLYADAGYELESANCPRYFSRIIKVRDVETGDVHIVLRPVGLWVWSENLDISALQPPEPPNCQDNARQDCYGKVRCKDSHNHWQGCLGPIEPPYALGEIIEVQSLIEPVQIKTGDVETIAALYPYLEGDITWESGAESALHNDTYCGHNAKTDVETPADCDINTVVPRGVAFYEDVNIIGRTRINECHSESSPGCRSCECASSPIEVTPPSAPIVCATSSGAPAGGSDAEALVFGPYDTLGSGVHQECETGVLSITFDPMSQPDWIHVVYHDTENDFTDGTSRTDGNGDKKSLGNGTAGTGNMIAADADILLSYTGGSNPGSQGNSSWPDHAPTTFVDNDGTQGNGSGTDEVTIPGGRRYISVIVNWNDGESGGTAWNTDISYDG
jgi:hypothetical protein